MRDSDNDDDKIVSVFIQLHCKHVPRYVVGSDVDVAASGSATVGPGAAETGSFRTASGGSGTGSGGGGGGGVNPSCVTVMSEPPSTHESCLPHLRDDCNRHLLFGCLSATASALSNAFVLIQVSRFQQIIGVFTLQAPTEVAKVTMRDNRLSSVAVPYIGNVR